MTEQATQSTTSSNNTDKAQSTPCTTPFYKKKSFWAAATGVAVAAGAVVAVRTGHLNLDIFKRVPTGE